MGIEPVAREGVTLIGDQFTRFFVVRTRQERIRVVVNSTRTVNRQYVSTAEAARMAGLSGHALARRVREGELQHFIDPSDRRVRLFDVTELERYLQPRPARREEVSAA